MKMSKGQKIISVIFLIIGLLFMALTVTAFTSLFVPAMETWYWMPAIGADITAEQVFIWIIVSELTFVCWTWLFTIGFVLTINFVKLIPKW